MQQGQKVPFISWDAIAIETEKRTAMISDGLDAKVYKGTWNGKSVAIKQMNFFEEILLLEGKQRAAKKKKMKKRQEIEETFTFEGSEMVAITQSWEEFANEVYVLR